MCSCQNWLVCVWQVCQYLCCGDVFWCDFVGCGVILDVCECEYDVVCVVVLVGFCLLLCYGSEQCGDEVVCGYWFEQYVCGWVDQCDVVFVCFCQQDGQIVIDEWWFDDVGVEVVVQLFVELQFVLCWMMLWYYVVVCDDCDFQCMYVVVVIGWCRSIEQV